MAVTLVTLLNAGRSGDLNDEYKRNYVKTFRVVTNDPLDGPATATGANGIPLRHSTYFEPLFVDRFALCESVEARPEEEEFPLNWIVTAKFSTDVWDRIRKKGGDNQESQQPENPVLEPAQLDYDTQDGPTLVQAIDINGVKVANSAGELFEGKQIIDALVVMTITKNFASYNPNDAFNYYNTLNLDLFFGFPPNTVKCKGLKGSSQFKNNFFYWKVTGIFHVWTRVMALRIPGSNATVKLKGWELEEAPMDKGFKMLVAGVQVPITDAGVPVPHEVLLDGAGGRLGDLLTPTYALKLGPIDPATGNNTSLPKFQFYYRMPFSALGF